MSEELKDFAVYNERMRKSLMDKAFFLDKVEARVFLDFGCADGTLLKFMHTLFPELTFVGYDNDPTMVKLARKNLEGTKVHVLETHDAVELFLKITEDPALILSSVVHEALQYGSDEDCMWFKLLIADERWKNIIYRDMARSYEMKILADEEDIRKVRESEYSDFLIEFEEVWGSINTQRNLVHFLMKYRYSENWEREKNEDYFVLGMEEAVSLLFNPIHEVIFFEHYALPYQKRIIEQDFGIELGDPTHLKFILERK